MISLPTALIQRPRGGRPRVAIAARLVAVVAALAAPPSSAAAQEAPKMDRERGRIMLRQVRAEIERHFYDATFKGVDLAARFAELDARIQQAASLGDIFASVATYVLQLDDSHTFFVPPRRAARVDYGWDMLMVGDSCFVARAKPGSDAVGQGVSPGDLVISVNGYPPTRDNLWHLWYLFRVLRPQPGLRVVLRAPGGTPRQLDLAAQVREGPHVVDLTSGVDVARLIREAETEVREMRPLLVELGPDVLIWKLPTFDVSEAVIRDGIKRARKRKALILDLRDNVGGPVTTLLALLGRLGRDDVVIGTQRERKREMTLVAKGAGDDAVEGRLVVLVNSRSASASEVLARAVQLANRGVVFGDRTAGSVTRGRYHPLSVGVGRVVFFGVNVTDADLVMSDGGRLEGVGVLPDTVVLPSATDLASGKDPVLARALTLAGRATDAVEAGALLRRQ